MSDRSTQGARAGNDAADPGADTAADRLTTSQRAAVLHALAAAAPALGAVVVERDHLDAGDLPIVVAGTMVGGIRVVGLHGALDRLIDLIEREIGEPVEGLDRRGKQAVVRRLDELGAFDLRKAVEDIADRLHVSRFTVYNYLNSHA